MKQHISVEQYRNSTDTLRAKVYTLYPEDNPFCERFYTIGKMIEMLENKLNGISLELNGSCGLFLYSKDRMSGDNLCDGLWEAVKECLG